MLCKQQQLVCHIIPGDMGTALQLLGSKWCGANGRAAYRNQKSFEPCTLSQSV